MSNFKEYLLDGQAINKMFSISTATRQRMKHDGRLSPPDVSGGSGSSDKWLVSTAKNDLARMCGKVEEVGNV
ncbi:MAG: hypothetical protein QM504_17905 [Pseudomonadota bacterium]